MQTHRPSLIKIIGGMLKFNHLRQFISIIIAICIILWIIRFISFLTLVMIIFSGGTFMVLLTWIENICKKREARNRGNNQDDYSLLLDEHEKNPWQVRYDLHVLDEVSEDQKNCGICLKPLKQGTEVATLGCMHSFHPGCIEKWAKVQTLCPMCKTSFE